jgi:arginine decarboxylase
VISAIRLGRKRLSCFAHEHDDERTATAPPLAASTSSTTAWSVQDASELYEVPRWGNGYFSVNAAGHVQVHPTKDPARAIDMKELIDRLQLRGISLPCSCVLPTS